MGCSSAVKFSGTRRSKSSNRKSQLTTTLKLLPATANVLAPGKSYTNHASLLKKDMNQYHNHHKASIWHALRKTVLGFHHIYINQNAALFHSPEDDTDGFWLVWHRHSHHTYWPVVSDQLWYVSRINPPLLYNGGYQLKFQIRQRMSADPSYHHRILWNFLEDFMSCTQRFCQDTYSLEGIPKPQERWVWLQFNNGLKFLTDRQASKIAYK